MCKQLAGIYRMLMRAAYCVHGAIAPFMPFDIPVEQKIVIKQCIRAIDQASAYPVLVHVVNSDPDYGEQKKKE